MLCEFGAQYGATDRPLESSSPSITSISNHCDDDLFVLGGMNIEFQLIVPESSQELYDEWQRALDEFVPLTIRSQFHFVRSTLNDLPGTRFDAIVSPANSYGQIGRAHV